MQTFQIGDVVRVRRDLGGPKQGDTGEVVVVGLHSKYPVGVRIFGFTDGHNLTGRAGPNERGGWWFNTSQLELLNAKLENE